MDDSSTVVRFGGHYRLVARHRLEFSYIDLSRDGKTITSRPIIIDDTIFPKGSELSTEFDYQVLKFAYAYSFWQTEKFDLSASGGLYTFDIDLVVESIGGDSEDGDGTAPFPTFGLHLDYRLEEDVYFTSSLEYFFIHEDDFEGEIIDASIGIEYRPFKNIGFGLGYNAVALYAESIDDDDEFDYEYEGLLFTLSLNY